SPSAVPTSSSPRPSTISPLASPTGSQSWAWCSSDAFGTWNTSDGFDLYNNEWNSSGHPGPQRICGNSGRDWQVTLRPEPQRDDRYRRSARWHQVPDVPRRLVRQLQAVAGQLRLRGVLDGRPSRVLYREQLHAGQFLTERGQGRLGSRGQAFQLAEVPAGDLGGGDPQPGVPAVVDHA